jgi:hypothetical protein
MFTRTVAGVAFASLAFVAMPAAGQEGHDGHGDDAGHEGHAEYPDLEMATRRQVRQARRLRQRTERGVARFQRWPRARRAGYVEGPKLTGRPYLFHGRLRGSFQARDRRLKPWLPEALMYWRPQHGRAILVGAMYRVPADKPPPRLGGPILGWHEHGGRTQMTHLWLTGRTRTAFARCMPLAALQAAIPRFHWSEPVFRSVPETDPCQTT